MIASPSDLKIERIKSPCCFLGEGPLWNPKDQAIYWIDIMSGNIWRKRENQKECQLIHELGEAIGGITFTIDNNIIACSQSGIYLIKNMKSKYCAEKLLVSKSPLLEGERFNDLITDSMGRLYVGTITAQHTKGRLLCLSPNAKPEILLEGLQVSNGLCFNKEETKLFHTDSFARTITRYDFNRKSGRISNPFVFYKGLKELGFPDGITMDSQGFIWVACWGVGLIIRLSPDGIIERKYSLDAKQPSSLTFGGSSMNQLYITSAWEGGDPLNPGFDDQNLFLGGYLYQLDLSSFSHDKAKSIGREEQVTPWGYQML